MVLVTPLFLLLVTSELISIDESSTPTARPVPSEFALNPLPIIEPESIENIKLSSEF